MSRHSKRQQNRRSPGDTGRTIADIVIVVEDGRVTDVYASTGSEVLVEVIDRDTQDPKEESELNKRIKCLEAEAAAGRMISVY
ncbi:hypothetical protein D7V91_11670 [bacterium 1xD42-67]|nr:hypothetical protein D7V91_11670 [bacterium 1xD42-67]